MKLSAAPSPPRFWLYFGLIGLVMVGALLLWGSLLYVEQERLQVEAKSAAKALTFALTERLGDRVAALKRMASRWGVQGHVSKPLWVNDAQAYVAHYKAFQAIEWADTSNHVRWVVPLKGNEAVLGLSLVKEGRRREALKASRRLRKPMFSRMIDLVQGGKGVLAFVPIFAGGRFHGFIVGAFKLQQMLDLVVPPHFLKRFEIEVHQGQQLLWRRAATRTYQVPWQAKAKMPVYGTSWQILLTLRPNLMADAHSALPWMILLGGVMAACLLLLLAFQIQRSHQRALALAEAHKVSKAVNEELVASNALLAEQSARRERTQRALAKSEAEHLAFVGAIPDKMFRLNKDGLITDFRQPKGSVFYVPPDKFLNHTVFELFPPEVTGPEMAAIHAALETKEMQSYDFSLHMGGEEHFYEGRVSPINDQEVILISRDVTMLHATTRALENKNKDLETMFYISSHDLREPLRSIENFSRLLKRRYEEALDERGQDYLSRIIRAAERLDQLMEDLLILSRAQRFTISHESCSMREVAENALLSLEETIESTGASVTISTARFPAIPLEITWATQAVFGLLTNALKFVEEGKTPEITIEPYEEIKNGFVERGLSVLDRGMGIESEYHSKVFQLFKRAVGREIAGTGAGLAIVQQVAERHGGLVWVENRPGGGSAFHLVLSRVQREVIEGDEHERPTS